MRPLRMQAFFYVLQPLPSPMNTCYKITVHRGDEEIATFVQEVYRTAKLSLNITNYKKLKVYKLLYSFMQEFI